MAARVYLQAILALFCVGLAAADEPVYHWPLDTRPALTSTFGEYRNGRFHAGVDLKTWGKEGFPVWAIDDGEVVRLRTSPWGYGRVIYEKLRDGRTAVYAHLSGFAPRLAARVEAAQDRKGFYSVDLALDRAQLPIRRGEVIGYSGSSGVGTPHLHFEMRDAEDRPINALEHGFSVADSLPPTILKLALLPLTPFSTVDDGHDPNLFEVAWNPEQHRYLAPGRVSLSGSIGVAVDAFDRADASATENKLAPYRLRLLVDGAEAFEVTYSGFSYSENNQVDLDRNFALSRRGAGHLYNLFIEKGNHLSLYGRFREGDGVLHAENASENRGVTLSQGIHQLRIIAEDISGNHSEAEVEVLADAPPEVTRAPLNPSVPEAATLTCTAALHADFALLSIVSDRDLNAPPRVSAAWPGDGNKDLGVRQTDPKTYEAVLPFTPDGSGDIVVTVSGGPTMMVTQQTVTAAGGVVRSADGTAEARFEPNRVYGPLFARAEPVSAQGNADLSLAGTAYRFTPDDVPFDGKAEVALRYAPGLDRPEKLGLYRRLNSGGWAFVDNRLDRTAGVIRAEVSSFSTFALLRDETPPVIADLQPSSGAQVRETRPIISATVRDNGSGIWREEDLVVTIDGKRLIVEYDPDRETIKAQPRQPLRPGRHRFEVIVRDISGNEARAAGAFTVKKP